jgi:hypothetical protein
MRRSCLLSLLLLPLCWLAPAQPADKDAPLKGSEALFNGKDLTGWEVLGGKFEGWGNDKTLIYTARADGGWLMTEKEYGDFELTLEWRVPKGGSSGVVLRSPSDGDPTYTGVKIAIVDNASNKKLEKSQYAGSIYGVVAPSKDATKAVGEWNKYEITAKGRNVIVKLNGEEVVNANLDTYKDKFKAYPGLARDKGHLGLQGHGGRVEFRNLYVKPLK